MLTSVAPSRRDYNKQAAYARAGVGRDFISDSFSSRFEVMYMAPAMNERTRYPNGTNCKCTNGLQGIDIHVWLPSPASSSHFLFHTQFTGVRYHDTITDPNSQVLLKSEGSQHAVDSFLSYGFITRW